MNPAYACPPIRPWIYGALPMGLDASAQTSGNRLMTRDFLEL
jgi:hypothetical protein